MSDKTQSIKNLYAAIDNQDADEFVSFLTDDSSFAMSDVDPVVGKENIREAVGGFFQSIKGLSHNFEEIIESGNKVISPGVVTYTRHDDTTLSVKYCNIFTYVDNKIKGYDVFVDISKLYA